MSNNFINDNFLLETDYAQTLYHEYAKKMPIIDYHCHLNPKEIAENIKFDNLSQIWLAGDHYKWRAMRTNGINEELITGDKSDNEKFDSWAQTVPYTLRNPLYHWTHLELKNTFGITTLLSPQTSSQIYKQCNAKLVGDDFSCRSLITKANVEVICTTDDPIDDLKYHKEIKKSGFTTRVFPTWRPDKAMAVECADDYNKYINSLENISGVEIDNFDKLILALNKRHDFFAENGCKLSDHGIEEFYADDFNIDEIHSIFKDVRKGKELTNSQVTKFKSAMLLEFARMDAKKGWVQQFHYGAIRNNNSKMFNKLGPDTGYDSIGEFNVAKNLSKFLNTLEKEGNLTKTIIYNINPNDNDMIATMIANFQDGEIAGKMQFGSGWWFLDQKNGMEAQINSLSNHGLLSRFVGMLTDSRSFLSYSRHEYFRRILCNMLGNDMQKGIVPNDIKMIGKMVEDICYNNAKEYFKL